MKIVSRLVLAAAMGFSLFHAARQLREVAAVKKSLAGATDPSAALAALSKTASSGPAAELAAAYAAQLAKMDASDPEGGSPSLPGLPGAALGAAPAAAPEPLPEPPKYTGEQVGFTPTARVIRLKPGEAVPPDMAVMVDSKTGERLAVRRTKRPAPAPSSALPPLPEPLRAALSDDLTARRNRAYALLLGTVAVAVVLVIRAKRSMGGVSGL